MPSSSVFSVSSSVWQIHLLGGLRVVRGPETITRFRSQKFGALLAYLALFPHRLHSREELADLLWPDTEPELARGNLRAALSSLRRQMEPPGAPAGSVFVTEGRTHLHLNRDAILTDVAQFEAALAAAAKSTGEAARASLATALGWYAGPLLPGYYEPWALSERDRLSEAQVRALLDLSRLWEQAGDGEQASDGEQALDCARRAVSSDPLREESHAAVIRLLMRSGQAAAARRQFEELSRLLREHYDSEPEPETRALLDTKAMTTATAMTTAPAAIPVVSIPAAASAPAPAAPAVESVEPESVESVGSVGSVGSAGLVHHFPLMLTRFFGREEEMAALRAQLVDGDGEWQTGGQAGDTGDTRLVTITGPGGSGKTRFAVETARSLGRHFPGGIWFVPLVDVREAERLPEVLAGALAPSQSQSQSPSSTSPSPSPSLTQVVEALSTACARGGTGGSNGGRCLLVLDNFEQLAETGSSVVAALLGQVPGLHCLVTSRQRLRLEGEREFALVPLPTPEYPGTPERLVEFSSVALFVSRAQGARADFQLTGRNAPAVASLCARLEGMPLAIELAAAWMSVLSPSQMLERLARRLGLLDEQVLVSRRRDVSPRHRTLRAAIESSVELLSAPVRGFFASLSVFRGGWTLAAAESGCGEPMALEYLTELADHSLIVRVMDPLADSDGVDVRFRMLETLREYAEELQSQRPEETERLRAAHARWALQFAEHAAPFLTGGDQLEWLHRLQVDHDNLREALRFLLEHDVEAELRLAVALFRFWQSRGPITEAHDWLERGLERNAASGEQVSSPEVMAQALECSGTLAWYRSDIAGAKARLQESIALYRELGDGIGVARAINSFAGMQNIADDADSARALLEEGLAEMTALGGESGAAGRHILLEALTRDAVIRDDRVTAKRYGDEWMRLARASRDHHLIAAAITWESFAAINAGEYGRAEVLLTESLSLLREVNEALYVCSALWGLGYIALFTGDAARAGVLQRRAMRAVAGLTGYDFSIVHVITAIAAAALYDGQPQHAARLMGAGSMLRERLGYPLAPVLVKVDLEQLYAEARRVLGVGRFSDAFTDGANLTPDEAIQESLRDWS